MNIYYVHVLYVVKLATWQHMYIYYVHLLYEVTMCSWGTQKCQKRPNTEANETYRWYCSERVESPKKKKALHAVQAVVQVVGSGNRFS